MYYADRMMTVERICDELGRKNLALSLGVSKAAISNAIAAERFSARWYRIVSTMCEDSEIDCPKDLFGFIEPTHDELRPAE
jgi:hypothetical protein